MGNDHEFLAAEPGGLVARFDAFGVPFDHRVGRLEEALQIITPLLKTGRVDFQGRYYQVNNCAIDPPGPRPTGPPILVAGSGPRMLKLTATYADAWNIVELAQPEMLAQPRAALEAACAEVGRDPSTLAVTVGLTVAYPDLESPPRALDTYRRAIPRRGVRHHA
jgi:alkanesulfonate monooxygenase SsuD/methylene tetrahydromethanopterin reductase-like flavin-dependent oxidoreductase (luciferase family)